MRKTRYGLNQINSVNSTTTSTTCKSVLESCAPARSLREGPRLELQDCAVPCEPRASCANALRPAIRDNGSQPPPWNSSSNLLLDRNSRGSSDEILGFLCRSLSSIKVPSRCGGRRTGLERIPQTSVSLEMNPHFLGCLNFNSACQYPCCVFQTRPTPYKSLMITSSG